jgi:outer membrane protein assembly factor BamD
VQLRSLGRLTVLLVLCAAIAVSGCSVFKKKKPTLAYEERPVELLFSVGADDLDRHQWNDAVNYFREVERQHPYSEWSRRAILMTAYAHYEANDYSEAIADADRFIALYPGNASTAYAYYIKAICYFEQIVDVGRDQAYTQNAEVSLGDVIKRYPNTEYAVDSRLKRDMVMDQLAGKEMTIGRFYLRSGNPIAAIGRFRTVGRCLVPRRLSVADIQGSARRRRAHRSRVASPASAAVWQAQGDYGRAAGRQRGER